MCKPLQPPVQTVASVYPGLSLVFRFRQQRFQFGDGGGVSR